MNFKSQFFYNSLTKKDTVDNIIKDKTDCTLFFEKEREKTMRKQVFSLLVDNNPGVLSRISGLFSRRGYSIDRDLQGLQSYHPAMS